MWIGSWPCPRAFLAIPSPGRRQEVRRPAGAEGFSPGRYSWVGKDEQKSPFRGDWACTIPRLLAPAELDRLRVVLVGTRNPLNIGAATRAISNFGFFHLRVVNPYDLAFREARSAVGAADLLASAEQFSTTADAVSDCALVVGTTAVGHRDPQHPLLRLEQGARLMREQLATGRVAILFGSEKRGLSNEDLSHCHWLLRIPTREEHGSMNLGQAVAVCLYELIRNAEPAPIAYHAPPNPGVPSLADEAPPASAGKLERLTDLLFDALAASGYLDSHPPELKREKLRRMVRRLNLSDRDAEVWLGMMRQIVWKLKGGAGL
jgi:TrmH family RNA methyltransferase